MGINQTWSSDCALPASGNLQFRDFQSWRFYSIFAFNSPWWPFLPWQGFPLLFWREPEWWYGCCEQLTCLKCIYICRWESIPALHFTAFYCQFVRIAQQNKWLGSVVPLYYCQYSEMALVFYFCHFLFLFCKTPGNKQWWKLLWIAVGCFSDLISFETVSFPMLHLSIFFLLQAWPLS